MADNQSHMVFWTRNRTITLIVGFFIVIVLSQVKQIEAPPLQQATTLMNGVKTFPVPERYPSVQEQNHDLIQHSQSEVLSFQQLNLKLHGIVYKANNAGYAMLSRNGSVQEIYGANAQPLAGLTVKQIGKKSVQFEYHNELFTLGMSSMADAQTPLISTTNVPLFTALTLEEQQALTLTDKQRNPIRFLMIGRPHGVVNQGKFMGYKINPGANIDQFRRLGFEHGDIITYLNGVEVNEPGKSGFLINELTQASNIDLTVLRGEDELSITYGF